MPSTFNKNETEQAVHLETEKPPASSENGEEIEKKIMSSSGKLPHFHNSSINSNPYLNRRKLENLNKKTSKNGLSQAKNAEISNPNYHNRNLSILSRNLRNITFLKSSNPCHGSKMKDKVLDLKVCDFSNN